jgi:hypothetical protein
MFKNTERKEWKDLNRDEKISVFTYFVDNNCIGIELKTGDRIHKTPCWSGDTIYFVPAKKTVIDWSCIHPDFRFYKRDLNSAGFFSSHKPEIGYENRWSLCVGRFIDSALLSDKVIQVGEELWNESLIIRPDGE